MDIPVCRISEGSGNHGDAVVQSTILLLQPLSHVCRLWLFDLSVCLSDLSVCMLLAGLIMLRALTNALIKLRASTNALIENPAGGSSVLVNQLQYQPLEALEGLGELAELHAKLVWDSLLTFSGTSVPSSVQLLAEMIAMAIGMHVTVDHSLLSILKRLF